MESRLIEETAENCTCNRCELLRAKRELAYLTDTNKMLIRSRDWLVDELSMKKRDLATATDHRDRLIESNRVARAERDDAYRLAAQTADEKCGAVRKLEAFAKIMHDASIALAGTQ